MSTRRTNELAQELCSLLGQVVGTWALTDSESAEGSSAEQSTIFVLNDQHHAILRSSALDERMVLLCSESPQVVGRHEPMLRKLLAVFRSDLDVIGASEQAGEIWAALSETRLIRAATRVSNISTEYLVKRMRVFEAASRQTYEGAPFVGSVVMAHNLRKFEEHAGTRFHPFKHPISFERALLHEKWLKPFLEAGEFALVTTSYRGTARGFTDATVAWPTTADLSPTPKLDGLYGYLHPGTSLLSASSTGDIHFALPSGLTFVNSKGKWRYQDWTALRDVLTESCAPEVVTALMRLVRGASHEHRGSLFVVAEDDTDLATLIAGRENPNRPAEVLRTSVTGLKVTDPTVNRLLAVASRIDGAVVLDRAGNILDVACMVLSPTPRHLEGAGFAAAETFSGARSTAAWNASIHGVAIKVSDDGPVDVYKGGHLAFHTD